MFVQVRRFSGTTSVELGLADSVLGLKYEACGKDTTGQLLMGLGWTVFLCQAIKIEDIRRILVDISCFHSLGEVQVDVLISVVDSINRQQNRSVFSQSSPSHE